MKNYFVLVLLISLTTIAISSDMMVNTVNVGVNADRLNGKTGAYYLHNFQCPAGEFVSNLSVNGGFVCAEANVSVGNFTYNDSWVQANFTHIDGELLLLWGNVSYGLGEITLLAGNVSDINAQMLLVWGNNTYLMGEVSLLNGNVSAAWSNLSAHETYIGNLWGDVTLLRANDTVSDAELLLLKGNVSDLWTNASQQWAFITAVNVSYDSTLTTLRQDVTDNNASIFARQAADNTTLGDLINLKLNANDQRYNESSLINGKLDATDQRYNETSLIASQIGLVIANTSNFDVGKLNGLSAAQINASAILAVGTIFNDTALILLINTTSWSSFATWGSLGTTNTTANNALPASDQRYNETSLILLVNSSIPMQLNYDINITNILGSLVTTNNSANTALGNNASVYATITANNATSFNLLLLKTDQRYNETALIILVNQTLSSLLGYNVDVNITNLWTNVTSKLDTTNQKYNETSYVNTVNTTAFALLLLKTDQRFNETSYANVINTTAFSLLLLQTDQRYNESATVIANNASIFARQNADNTTLGGLIAARLLATDQRFNETALIILVNSSIDARIAAGALAYNETTLILLVNSTLFTTEAFDFNYINNKQHADNNTLGALIGVVNDSVWATLIGKTSYAYVNSNYLNISGKAGNASWADGSSNALTLSGKTEADLNVNTSVYWNGTTHGGVNIISSNGEGLHIESRNNTEAAAHIQYYGNGNGMITEDFNVSNGNDLFIIRSRGYGYGIHNAGGAALRVQTIGTATGIVFDMNTSANNIAMRPDGNQADLLDIGKSDGGRFHTIYSDYIDADGHLLTNISVTSTNSSTFSENATRANIANQSTYFDGETDFGAIGQNTIPSSDAIIILGNVSKAWKEIYATGGIYVDGTATFPTTGVGLELHYQEPFGTLTAYNRVSSMYQNIRIIANRTLFRQGTTEVIEITPSGNMIPIQDNAYSLGTASNRWSNVWSENITSTNGAGTGNAYACFDANGQLYRSVLACA